MCYFTIRQLRTKTIGSSCVLNYNLWEVPILCFAVLFQNCYFFTAEEELFGLFFPSLNQLRLCLGMLNKGLHDSLLLAPIPLGPVCPLFFLVLPPTLRLLRPFAHFLSPHWSLICYTPLSTQSHSLSILYLLSLAVSLPFILFPHQIFSTFPVALAC